MTDPYDDPFANEDDTQPDNDDAYDPAEDDGDTFYDEDGQGYDLAEDPDEIDDAIPGFPPPTVGASVTRSGGVTCNRCGTDLAGATLGGQCPSCGEPIIAKNFASGQQTSGNAVASLVLGILSLPSCLCCGIVSVLLGALAVSYSQKAVKDVETGRAAADSLGMAKAGKICGIIGLALGMLLLFLRIFAMILNGI